MDTLDYKSFTSGDYIKKEDLMLYLNVLSWDMSREDLIKKLEELPAINLSEQDINKVITNKILRGEWK